MVQVVIVYVRFKILNIRVVFYWRKVTKVIGVNSLLSDGLHVPMIDTDSVELSELRDEVHRLLARFGLSHASILSTGRPNSFHVYIWHRVEWRKAIEIVASCRYTDLKHLYFSMRRGHFTLRVSKKKHREIEIIEHVGPDVIKDVSYKELENFTMYETASKI